MAAEAAKKTADAKAGSEAILNSLLNDGKLKEEEFRIGLTKVSTPPNNEMHPAECCNLYIFQIFFKAGIMARMEEFRDEKLSQILTGLQARIRYYIAKSETKRREQQR